METKQTALENKLLKIVTEIVNNSFCLSCKNYSTNIECNNCKEENKKLKVLYTDLELTLLELKFLKLENDKINLILYALKKYQIKSKLISIKEIDINNFINKIVDKIKKNEDLTEEEKINLSILLKTKVVNNEVINNFVILNCLNKKNYFDIDTISSVICMFAETMYDSKKMNLKCKVESLHNLKGKAEDTFIYLSKTEIERFANGEMDALFTLFHEYIHVLQYYRQIILQSSSVEDIKQIKERIIRQHNPKFYDDNKYVYSLEKEANIEGNTYLVKYLDSIGFPIISFEDIKRIVDNDIRNVDNDFRIVGEDTILIDDEFNRVVKPNDFNCYPQLGYEYKIENSRVVLKDLEEIYSDIEYVNASTEYSNHDKKILMDIYKDIIHRYPVNYKKKN